MKQSRLWSRSIYLGKRSNIRNWQVPSQDLNPGLPGSEVLTSDHYALSRDLGPPGSGADSFPVQVCETVELNGRYLKAPPRLISCEPKFCFTRVCLLATWSPVDQMSLPRAGGYRVPGSRPRP